MFASDDPHEKLAAALPLVGLGDAKAFQSLCGFITTLPEERRRIASALPWLSFDARLELFTQLRSAAGDAQMLGVLAEEMGVIS